MRIIAFLALATMLSMCKTKEKIEVKAPIIYNVLLQKDASPKKLMKDLIHEITDFDRTSRTENRWRLIFKNQGSKSSTIKRDLLNHNMVISVFDEEEMGAINSKNTKKGKSTIMKQDKPSKQK